MFKTRLNVGISDKDLTSLYNAEEIQKTGDDRHPAKPITHDLLRYISATVDGRFAGAFILIEFSEYEREAHCLLLESSIHHMFKLIGSFLDFVFIEDAGVERITGWVRSDKTSMLNHYKKHGFQIEGRKRRAVTVDGKWLDLILIGLTRDDWSS